MSVHKRIEDKDGDEVVILSFLASDGWANTKDVIQVEFQDLSSDDETPKRAFANPASLRRFADALIAGAEMLEALRDGDA